MKLGFIKSLAPLFLKSAVPVYAGYKVKQGLDDTLPYLIGGGLLLVGVILLV